MNHAPRHTDTHHAEQARAFQKIHDGETEYAAGKGINHTEDTAEQKPGHHNSSTVY